MPMKMIVDGALALERAGHRAEATALLDRYMDGTLTLRALSPAG